MANTRLARSVCRAGIPRFPSPSMRWSPRRAPNDRSPGPPGMKVFLTGGWSAMGGALARHYAGADATRGFFARREAELARLAASLGPATVVTYAGDVRDAAAL